MVVVVAEMVHVVVVIINMWEVVMEKIILVEEEDLDGVSASIKRHLDSRRFPSSPSSLLL
ncbi:unnamed protein product [Brassica napus]|uniref:(rape) hypothetical protein n=1 Tax=Brassica napus TaxID=3708 RepID=A0A816Q045_BRANA|nr:unnamed protein product [Brassica napus]